MESQATTRWVSGGRARTGKRAAACAGRVLCGAVVAALVLAASAARCAEPAPKPEAPAPVTFKPTKEQLASLKIVTVAAASFRDEHTTDGKIALNADRSTPVFSPYSGRVTKIQAKIGDVVHQGQTLFSLQASEFVQGQSDLLAAQSGLSAARAQLSLAEATERRKHALFDAKAGSLQDWDQSRSDLTAAQSAERTATAALAAVRNRLAILGKSEEEIDALGRAEHMDPVAFVVAPISGTVTDKQVGMGQYVQSGAGTPAYTVSSVDSVWLVANVRETDAPLVRIGQELEVHLVAFPERSFNARITFVSPTLDPNTRRMTVRAEIANPDHALKPEMFATFKIVSGARSKSPAVPISGVIFEEAQARVWVQADDGSLALRRFKPGQSANGLLEALDGISVGEKVVASGALFIDRAAQGD